MSASKEARFILKTDGTPFKNEKAAKSQATLLAKQGINVIPTPHGDGFALEKTSSKLVVQPETQPDTSKRQRPHRKRMDTRNVLDCDHRPGYVRRWVLDAHGDGRRLQRFVRIGYDFVDPQKRRETPTKSESEGDAGKPTQMGSATTRAAGGGQTLHLMEIPEDWYEEAQEEKEEETKKREAAIINPRGLVPVSEGGTFGVEGTRIDRR